MKEDALGKVHPLSTFLYPVMKTCPFIILALLVVSMAACHSRHGGTAERDTDTLQSALQDSLFALAAQYPDTCTIRYAQCLRITHENGVDYVDIADPADKNAPEAHLAICRDAADKTILKAGYTPVKAPVKGLIITTALQMSNFSAIGRLDCIVGINSMHHLYNPVMRRQIADGQTLEIGKEGAFNQELVIATHPDLILVSASKRGGFSQLKDCGIPLVVHHGYKETDPLGQAEWVKLAGLLTGQTARANAVFSHIESQYNGLRDRVAKSGVERPTVLSGNQVREGWYVVGGKSYLARLFEDAGADYIFKDNEETGGRNIDFEAAYAQSLQAEFWQIDGNFQGSFSYQRLQSEDPRYADLQAFKNRRVVFCDFSVTPYREQAPMEPHVLLADFVKAFHPELIPDYKPYYYKLLE